MNRSEQATAKIKTAFGAFGGIVNRLLKLLQPLGEFLIDGIVAGLELVEKSIETTIGGISKALKFLGFDDASEAVEKFNKEIAEGAKLGKQLAQAELELAKAQRTARLTQLDFQKDAEKLRQLRDDETKTIAQRIKANEDLGAVLKEQLGEELKIAQQALNVANLRIQAEGETSGALDAQADALTEIADIQERITGQESEQLTNRVSLQREASQKAIELMNAELDLFIQQQGFKAKSLEEQTELEKREADKRKAIFEAELKAKQITQTEFDAKLLESQNALGLRLAEIAVENANNELKAFNDNNKSKVDSNKFLTEGIVEEERLRLDNIAEARRNFEAVRLEEGVINQQAFNEAINEINAENEEAKKELELERKEAVAEQDAIDFENQLAILEERNESQFLIEQLRLDRLKEAELASAEATGADIDKINKKFALLQKRLDDNARTERVASFSGIASDFTAIVGESSETGKAFATATALADTFLGAQKAYTSQLIVGDPTSVPRAILAGASATAVGLRNVAKIRGIKLRRGGVLKRLGFGGVLEGPSHENGGIPIRVNGQDGVEAEGGEAVINTVSTRKYRPLLSAINIAGGGKSLMRGGGILGTGNSLPDSVLNMEALGRTISEANRSLPPNVLDLQEFRGVEQNLSTVETLADL